MRVGIIGVGRIGRFHARLLRDHPDVTSIAVTDADPDRAAAVASEVRAEVHPSVDALLGAVDAVVIAAPTRAHADLLGRALDAGLPIFCEKPITLDLETTDELVARVEQSGIPVQLGFQRRFDPGYGAARDRVAAGELGTVFIVRMVGHDPVPPHDGYIPTSGGIFRDLHIHDFDIARHVLGQEVVEVYADGAVLAAEVFARYDDVDTAAAVLRFSGGTLGILSGTRHDPLGYDVRMELFGSADSAVVGWDARTPLRSLEPDGPAAPVLPYADFLDRFGPAYAAELDAFIDVARGRIPVPCTARDAREAMRIAVACDRSREDHRPVRLSEIP